jgi:hypothetical protein
VAGFEDGDLALLDDIALAGGTNQALVLGNEPEVNAAELISAAGVYPGDLSCDFPLPPPADNLDFTNVRVTLTTVNGASVRLERVPAERACADQGFYLDDPSSPARVVLCPGSCAGLVSRDYDTLEVSNERSKSRRVLPV